MLGNIQGGTDANGFYQGDWIDVTEVPYLTIRMQVPAPGVAWMEESVDGSQPLMNSRIELYPGSTEQVVAFTAPYARFMIDEVGDVEPFWFTYRSQG